MESIKIEVVKQIIEKIVEKEKLVYAPGSLGGAGGAAADCDCITEVQFV